MPHIIKQNLNFQDTSKTPPKQDIKEPEISVKSEPKVTEIPTKPQDLVKCKEYLIKSENWIKTAELKLAAADDADHPAEERKVCEVSTENKYIMLLKYRFIIVGIVLKEIQEEVAHQIRQAKDHAEICVPHLTLNQNDPDFKPILTDIEQRNIQITNVVKLIEEKLDNIQVAPKSK